MQVGEEHGSDDLTSIFTNKFATLKIVDDVGEGDGESREGSEVEAGPVNAARSHPQKKSKKGAKGKKSKTKR